MTGLLLSPQERLGLESYVGRNIKGAAYYNRANIVILADQGLSQEIIAVNTGVSISRVRQMLRAFDRDGVELFPVDMLVIPPFFPDDSITETSRHVMRGFLNKIESLEPELSHTTSVESVHETRKTIRRLRTALRLFAPYLPEKSANKYGKRFGKSMRRLGPSRDVAVFLAKLEIYMTESVATGSFTAEQKQAFDDLYDYWQDRKRQVDDKLRQYLAKGKFQRLLAGFQSFLETPLPATYAEENLAVEVISGPSKTRHLAPVMLLEKIAIARAFSDYLTDASAKKLHALRIEMKELRYSLEFFLPIMGNSASGPLEIVKDILTHLGDLNDARVHLQMLAKMEVEAHPIALAQYQKIKEIELAQLIAEFEDKWLLFDNPEWRQPLAEAMVAL
jgi:CHAD domain-containing protein